MTLIHRFFKLNNETRLLLIKALMVQWIIRLMLWLFSFNRIEKIVKRFSKVKPVGTSISLTRITWAVQVMGRFVPESTCLVRALSGQVLLGRYGYSSLVKIGVSRNKGEFEAHAWLEHDNEVVLGESERDFVPLRNLGE
jgi:hypothetical protein